MAEVLAPALAAADASGASSLVVFLLAATVVLAFFRWKVLDAVLVLISGLLGAIGKVLGS